MAETRYESQVIPKWIRCGSKLSLLPSPKQRNKLTREAGAYLGLQHPTKAVEQDLQQCGSHDEDARRKRCVRTVRWGFILDGET